MVCFFDLIPRDLALESIALGLVLSKPAAALRRGRSFQAEGSADLTFL
jgi:hypothetical protein